MAQQRTRVDYKQGYIDYSSKRTVVRIFRGQNLFPFCAPRLTVGLMIGVTTSMGAKERRINLNFSQSQTDFRIPVLPFHATSHTIKKTPSNKDSLQER